MNNIVELTPHWEQKVWGGRRLEQIKNLPMTDTPWGETFEVSVLGGHESRVGQRVLSEIISPRSMPYLVKLLDTSLDLSIQVHPDDQYAAVHESTSGKTECWVILDAQEGAGLFLGFRPGIDKEDFRQKVEAGEDISDALNFIPVQRGDFYYIPAGTIHAIGKGVTLLEVQQSSGVTYRVWDWNRLGLDGNPRELHIDKSFDVLNFSAEFQKDIESKQLSDIFSERALTLLETEQFCVRQYCLDQAERLPIRSNPFQRMTSIILVEGELVCDEIGQMKCCHSYLITEGSVEMTAKKDSKFILVE